MQPAFGIIRANWSWREVTGFQVSEKNTEPGKGSATNWSRTSIIGL